MREPSNRALGKVRQAQRTRQRCELPVPFEAFVPLYALTWSPPYAEIAM